FDDATIAQLTNNVIVQSKHENEEEGEVFDIDCQIEPLFPLAYYLKLIYEYIMNCSFF
ncbi:unnamed protein product, partial [Rotaria magnacalcarata]